MRHCGLRRGDRSHKSIGKKVKYYIKDLGTDKIRFYNGSISYVL